MLRITKTATVIAALALTAGSLLQSCDDDSRIGGTITNDDVQIIIDSAFTLSGHSEVDNSVRSRTIVQLLGSVNAPGYGNLASDVVTQFMPALEIDTTGITDSNIDSLKLQLIYEPGAFTGDSIAPLGLEVYRLTKDLPTPIFSNFNPTGYYDASKPLGSTIYSTSWDNVTDNEGDANARIVSIHLPLSLGRELFNAYHDNPSMFASPELFARNVFKGLYIRNSYGSGRILRVAKTMMNMYYHRTSKIEDTDRDTTLYYVGSYFAVTPEIISNNNISLQLSKDVTDLVDRGQSIIAAPAGLNAEVIFPGREIIKKYRDNISNLGVINSLEMSLYVDTLANKYHFTAPPYMLMVLKKDKAAFFAENKIADNKTSFYATYNSTTGCYSFSNLRQYIVDLLAKDEIKDEDVTFELIPVSISTETTQGSYYQPGSTTVTGIIPFVSWPAMCRINYDKTKIRFTYTKQTLN